MKCLIQNLPFIMSLNMTAVMKYAGECKMSIPCSTAKLTNAKKKGHTYYEMY